MSLAIRDASGVSRNISELVIRDAGNTPRTIKEMWVRTSVGLTQIFGKLALTLSPSAAYGSRAGHGTVTARTNAVTAMPNGGVAPLSYAWTRVDGGSHPWTIDSPSSPSTTFTTDVAVGVVWDATFRCTVTDASGATASADIAAECSNDGGTF